MHNSNRLGYVLRGQSAGQNQRNISQLRWIIREHVPINRQTRATKLSGDGGIDENRIGFAPGQFAACIEVLGDRREPALVEPASADDAVIHVQTSQELGRLVAMELNGLQPSVAASRSNSVYRFIDEYADNFRPAADRVDNPAGHVDVDAALASGIEIEPDRVGPGVDCCDGVIDTGDATNLDVECELN